MTENLYFHTGELHIQTHTGHATEANRVGKSIGSTIVPGAWGFLNSQPMLLLSSWNGERNVWPILLIGNPGFVSTQDGKKVCLDLSTTNADLDDPFWRSVRATGKISLLAIELSTRRRLRINGRVTVSFSTSLMNSIVEIQVEQAYANCPKYIQQRNLQVNGPLHVETTARESKALSDEQSQIIAHADTFFVASVHPEQGTDVSHRGGNPGFVKVLSKQKLQIPDYRGNNMFNTLGNIHATGFAGLLFIDFSSGRQLQILGDASIDWSIKSENVQLSWQVQIKHIRELLLPKSVSWLLLELSAFNP